MSKKYSTNCTSFPWQKERFTVTTLSRYHAHSDGETHLGTLNNPFMIKTGYDYRNRLMMLRYFPLGEWLCPFVSSSPALTKASWPICEFQDRNAQSGLQYRHRSVKFTCEIGLRKPGTIWQFRHLVRTWTANRYLRLSMPKYRLPLYGLDLFI